MIRYACNRLYYAEDKYLAPAVVCIDEEGKVISYALLEEETCATEWIGGVILLTSTEDMKLEADFPKTLSQVSSDKMPIYAWQIGTLDIVKHSFTAETQLRRLQ